MPFTPIALVSPGRGAQGRQRRHPNWRRTIMSTKQALSAVAVVVGIAVCAAPSAAAKGHPHAPAVYGARVVRGARVRQEAAARAAQSGPTAPST